MVQEVSWCFTELRGGNPEILVGKKGRRPNKSVQRIAN